MRGGLGHFALGLLALSVAGLFGCGKEGGRSTANVEPTCEVELVPGNSDEFVEDIESGDVQLVHSGDSDLQERSLITGKIRPLFDVAPDRLHTRISALDERDIFVVSSSGIQRFDRATGEHSLFSPHPEPEDDPALPPNPFYDSIAITETHVVAFMTDHAAYDFETETYPGYVLSIIDRASGEQRFLPVDQPTDGGWLFARGEHIFTVNSTQIRRGFTEGDVYAHDFETGTPEPFLHSSQFFYPAEYQIKTWGDFVLATTWPGDGTGANLVRVPLSGGEPQIVATGVTNEWFAVSGDEAFVLLHDERGQAGRGRLTAIDLTSGEKRSIGACDATPFHASDAYVYLYTDQLNLLRMTP